MGRPVVRISLVAMAALAAGVAVGVPAAAAAPPSTSCQVFPADNIWNTDISTLPVHAQGAQWLASMASSTTKLHPDFGGPPYGFPYNVVDNTHATVSVTFQYASESDPGPYPVGSDTLIEGGSDRHALILNRDTCTLYELFDLSGSGSSWTAGSGAIFPLGSNALRPLAGPPRTRRGCRSFPGWFAGTRCRRVPSSTRSVLPRSSRTGAFSGRPATRPARPRTPPCRRWACGSASGPPTTSRTSA